MRNRNEINLLSIEKPLFTALKRLARERLGGITKLSIAMGHEYNYLSGRENRIRSGLRELAKALYNLDLRPLEFFREHVFPGDKLPATAARISPDPLESFLTTAAPPPEHFRMTRQGFDDPISPEALSKIEKIEALRPENPERAACLCADLVCNNLNLNASLRGAVLWGSCLRLDLELEDAQAVLAEAYRIARETGLTWASAKILYQIAFVIADKAGSISSYHEAALMMERAALVYFNCGDLEGMVEALSSKAVFLIRAGDSRQARDILYGASRFARSPLLKGQIFGNLAHVAIHLRQLSAARKYAFDAAECLSEIETPKQDIGRLLWLQARLAENQIESESLFHQGRNLLRHLQADYALISLDLARSHLKWKNAEAAVSVAQEAALAMLELNTRSRLVQTIGSQLYDAARDGSLSIRLIAATRRAIENCSAARAARRFDRPR